MPRPHPRADWLHRIVEAEVRTRADPVRVRHGYELLGEILGEPAEGTRVKPVHQMLGVVYGDHPPEWHELGPLLGAMRSTPGFSEHRDKLLDDDQHVVQAKLAELSTLAVLLRNKVPAVLGRDPRPNGRVPDIMFGPSHQWDVEVSRLELPKTWDDAGALAARTEQQLWQFIRETGRAFVIIVEFDGYPGDLWPGVESAVGAFRRAAAASSTGEKQQLAPGFTFTWREDRPPFVFASGARVLGFDPAGNERVGQRLAAKIEEEASQVERGGVVLIHTEMLAIEGLGEDADALYANVLRDVRVSPNARHVGAIGILEHVVASRLPGLVRPSTARARSARVGGGGRWQRLLWVSRDGGAGVLPRRAAQWFGPPYPW